MSRDGRRLVATVMGVQQALERVSVTFDGPATLEPLTDGFFSVVDAAELRSAGPMVNLSESLSRVPGLVANLRNNYAQDLQISSRGFGARATFGIRGLRLYTDGIPATMPDGQGQVSHFDIAGAQRIEVLRGPFSALYGANSGGVISLVSAAPRADAYSLDGDVGSDGLWQARVGVEALLGDGWNIRALASQFNTDGVRPHSAAQRTLGNLRLGWVGDQDTRDAAAEQRRPAGAGPAGPDARAVRCRPLPDHAAGHRCSTRARPPGRPRAAPPGATALPMPAPCARACSPPMPGSAT